MKRHGFLFDKILDWPNLLKAANKAARGKKRRPEVARFFFHLETELIVLQDELRSGEWQPRPYRSFKIRDPKPRCISAADFRDRVVHHAIMNVLDPFFESRLINHSYACRRGKGTHAAVAHAQELVRQFDYYLTGDVDSFFESADHDVLKALLCRLFKDARLLALLDRILGSGGTPLDPGRGLPIGNLTSQYFANHILGQLDLFVKKILRVRGYLRFMDDFLLFGNSKEELHDLRVKIRTFLAEELRLRLKEEASVIAPSHVGVPFLGFRVYPGLVRLDNRRWRRMRRKIRRREAAYRSGTISAEDLAASVRSSIAHIQHAETRRLRQNFFNDSWGLG